MRETSIGKSLLKVKIMNSDYYSYLNKANHLSRSVIVCQDIGKLKIKLTKVDPRVVRKRNLNDYITSLEQINQESYTQTDLNQDIFRETFSNSKADPFLNLENQRTDITANDSGYSNKNPSKYVPNNTTNNNASIRNSKYLFYDYNKEIKKNITLSKNGKNDWEKTLLTSNCWAHNSCLLSNKNVSFEFLTTPIQILNFHQMKNIQKQCFICKSKSGSCYKCSEIGCNRSFHAECARRYNYDISQNLDEVNSVSISCAFHKVKSTQKIIDENYRERIKTLDCFFRRSQMILEQYKKNFEMISKFKNTARPIVTDCAVETESLIKYLEQDERHFLKEFKQRILKKKKFACIINLKKDSASTSKFYLGKVSIPNNSVFDLVPTENLIVWKLIDQPFGSDPTQNLQYFIKIQSIIQKVKFNFDFYFKQSLNGNYQQIKDFSVDPGFPDEPMISFNADSKSPSRNEFSISYPNGILPKDEINPSTKKIPRPEIDFSNLKQVGSMLSEMKSFIEDADQVNRVSKAIEFNYIWEQYFGDWSNIFLKNNCHSTQLRKDSVFDNSLSPDNHQKLLAQMQRKSVELEQSTLLENDLPLAKKNSLMLFEN